MDLTDDNMIAAQRDAAFKVAGRTMALEVLGVFVVVLLGYRMMWCEMRVDDVTRYVNELAADRYSWDLAHVWMQPVALWIYRALGRPPDPVPVLTWISTASVASGIAIFYWTLRSMALSRSKSLLAALLAAISFNLVSLGPTAHIKMMVFPYLALSLHLACVWDRDVCRGGVEAGRVRTLVFSGAAIGIGACLLVSMVPVIIGGWLFMLWRVRRSGQSWYLAFRSLMPYAVSAGTCGLAALGAAFLTGIASETVTSGFLDFVLHGLKAKYDIAPDASSPASMVARTSYSVVYNFVYLEYLGQYGRAYIEGFIPSLAPFVSRMLRELLWLVPACIVLCLALAFGIASGLRGKAPTLAALGYACGGLAYAFFINLNDPEHWIQLTLPILFCLTAAVPPRVFAAAALIWLPFMAIPNLWFYTYPRVIYNVDANARELQSRLGSRGLYMNYGAYPGNMTANYLPGIAPDRTILPDMLFESLKFDPKATLAAMDRQLEPAIAAGDPVIVFRILDDADWRGPAGYMAGLGLSPVTLRQHLRERYSVIPAGEVSGFPAWLLRAK